MIINQKFKFTRNEDEDEMAYFPHGVVKLLYVTEYNGQLINAVVLHKDGIETITFNDFQTYYAPILNEEDKDL